MLNNTRISRSTLIQISETQWTSAIASAYSAGAIRDSGNIL